MNSVEYQRPTSSITIGEAQKNIHETIRVDLVEWRGRTYIDVRVYLEDGRLSNRGVTAHPDVWAEIMPLLTQALETVEKMTGDGDDR